MFSGRCLDLSQYRQTGIGYQLSMRGAVSMAISGEQRRVGPMNPAVARSSPLDMIALGWGLSATLVVLFVICVVAALVLPDWPASHRWVELFYLAPLTSLRVWMDGIVFSIVFGWISAVVLSLVYNRVIHR
jgi:hypothetical protein